MRNLLCIIFMGFLCCINSTFSQSTKDTTWIIETKDGNNYVGTIKYLQDSLVQINASVGVLIINKKNIRSIIPLKKTEIVKGEFWPENPHSSRYFWGPSGYNLRKGEGYYQNTWIWLNQVSYGITKNISLGVGIIPLFLFGGGAESTPIWITPKISFPYKNNKGAVGFGTILFFIPSFDSESNNSSVGILYGCNTFGTRDKQLTLGLGLGYSSSGGFASLPTLSISGMIRTSKKWSLITENYLISIDSGNKFGIISGGARYMTRHLAIDFGGVIPIGLDAGIIMFPWLGIIVPFR